MSIQIYRLTTMPALTSLETPSHPFRKTHQFTVRQLHPRTRTSRATGRIASESSDGLRGTAAPRSRRLTTPAILGGSPRTRQVVPPGGAGNQKFPVFFFDVSNHTI